MLSILTPRGYLYIAVLVALALTSWAWLHERDVSAGLRRDLETARLQRDADVQAARLAGERAGVTAAAAATQCAGEGKEAFDRGVEVGRAICAARAQ